MAEVFGYEKLKVYQLATVNNPATSERTQEGREILRRITTMLSSLSKSATRDT